MCRTWGVREENGVPRNSKTINAEVKLSMSYFRDSELTGEIQMAWWASKKLQSQTCVMKQRIEWEKVVGDFYANRL